MPRRSNLLRGALWLIAISSIAMSSTARAQTESIVLRYEAPAECPDANEFIHGIRARTTKLDRIDEGERLFSVTLRAERDGFAGDLTTGNARPRHVVGASCDEVATAVALMIAIAIDPDATLGPIDTPAPVPIQPVVSPLPPPVRSEPSLPRSVAPPPVLVVPRTPAWALSTGGEVLVLSGLAPTVSSGVAIYGQLAHRAHDFVSPVVRWGSSFVDSGLLGGGTEDITVRRLVLQLEGCPTTWRPGSSVTVFPCVVVDAGALRGEGRNVQRSQTKTQATFGAGLSAHAQWQFASSMQVGLSVAAFSPMPRIDYVFEEPRRTAYASPWVLWSAGVGVGWVGDSF